MLSLQQALTGVESTTKNLKEMDKALLDGSMSFEQLINLASTLDDKDGLFYETLQKEGLENIGSFITKQLVEPYDTYLENIDSFIERQQAIINAAGEGEETLRKSAEQNIILAEAYRKEYLTFNKISLEHYMVEQKIADLEKESKNKNIKATEQLIILKIILKSMNLFKKLETEPLAWKRLDDKLATTKTLKNYWKTLSLILNL